MGTKKTNKIEKLHLQYEYRTHKFYFVCRFTATYFVLIMNDVLINIETQKNMLKIFDVEVFFLLHISQSYWNLTKKNHISLSLFYASFYFFPSYKTSIFLAYADIFLSIVKRLCVRAIFFPSFIECVLDGTRSCLYWYAYATVWIQCVYERRVAVYVYAMIS